MIFNFVGIFRIFFANLKKKMAKILAGVCKTSLYLFSISAEYVVKRMCQTNIGSAEFLAIVKIGKNK